MEFLERHFETAFDAPDGIEKLRELIVTLAMQGKLVEQDAEDLPAQDLLSRLRKARSDKYKNQKSNNSEAKTMLRKLGKLGTLKSTKRTPKNWVTTHLIDCCEYLVDCHNKTATYTDSGIPIIRTTNIRERQIRHQGMKYVSKDTYDFWARRCPPQPGDIIFTREAPMGEAAIIPEDMMCCLGQRTMLIRPMKEFINPQYLLLALTEPNLLKRASSSAIGSTVKHLRVGDVEKLEIPFPPLSEQRRIVAKIDQLMARCDELEKLRTERDQKRLTVHTAALNRLLTTQTSDSFMGAWWFIEQHFGELYSVKENVAELRKAILQLAVMGKLVEQDVKDQSVEKLLSKIQSEREALKLRNTVPKNQSLQPLEYEIPKNWKWQCLENLLIFGPTNGFSPKAVKYETPVRSLTLSATTSGTFKGEYSKFIANEIPADSDLWLEDGDILVQRGNTLEYVGVSAIYRGKSNTYIYPDLMMKLRVSSEMDINFVHLVMSSEACRDFLRARASGTSGTMPKINQKTLKSLPIPIPPLNEQHRIVAKVDQLMVLCDTLEQHIDHATHKQTALLNAVMA